MTIYARPTRHLRGDARKRLADPDDFPIRAIQTAAGRAALTDARDAAANMPGAQGWAVFLDVMARTWEA
jgi:hypothetical protein